MADFTGASRTSGRQRPRKHATRAYVLQPVRSRRMRIASWALVCTVCMLAGAAALHGYETYIGNRDTACGAPSTSTSASTSRSDLQDALERSELALKQEAASRATVQKSADALSAEVGRLKAQVLFLQSQSRSRR